MVILKNPKKMELKELKHIDKDELLTGEDSFEDEVLIVEEDEVLNSFEQPNKSPKK